MADRFDVKGSIVALITPFHEDGSINFEKLEELLEFHIANKTDGILVLGTTSESPTFTWQEDFESVKKSVEVCKGRIPLIVNAGSNDTRTRRSGSLRRAPMRCFASLRIITRRTRPGSITTSPTWRILWTSRSSFTTFRGGPGSVSRST